VGCCLTALLRTAHRTETLVRGYPIALAWRHVATEMPINRAKREVVNHALHDHDIAPIAGPAMITFVLYRPLVDCADWRSGIPNAIIAKMNSSASNIPESIAGAQRQPGVDRIIDITPIIGKGFAILTAGG